MSRPPIKPEKSLAGIALDPVTLERIIPESRRADGSVRKQIKIRPGFTPQEDIRRFRGTKQAQMDANSLPKGHIIGWAPPPGATTKPDMPATNEAASSSTKTPMTKAAKKNAKRKEKRDRERGEKENEDVPDNWEDDEEQVVAKEKTGEEKKDSVEQSEEDTLSGQLEKLNVN